MIIFTTAGRAAYFAVAANGLAPQYLFYCFHAARATDKLTETGQTTIPTMSSAWPLQFRSTRTPAVSMV